MHPISMSAFILGTATLVLIAASLSRSVGAEEAPAPEEPTFSCAVTDEQIVAATARQQVTLDTPSCTASVKHMVEWTFSRVHKDHAAFYKQTHLDPTAATDVSLLLVRRQLLSGGWSAGHVEHYTVSKDPALLADIEARLHEYLTFQQIVALRAYEDTIPARTLAEPVVSRLKKSARPLSEVQYEEALQELTQFFAEWLKSFPVENAADPLQRCRDTNARMNERDERIGEILARSFDEQQRRIAEGYYRDLFERRARMLQLYESQLASDENAICAYPPY